MVKLELWTKTDFGTYWADNFNRATELDELYEKRINERIKHLRNQYEHQEITERNKRNERKQKAMWVEHHECFGNNFGYLYVVMKRKKHYKKKLPKKELQAKH